MKTRFSRDLRRGRAGLTLIEVTLVTALIGLLGSGAIMMANMSARAYRTETTSADLVNAARRTFTEISERIRLSGSDQADLAPLVVAEPLYTNRIQFRPCTGYDMALGTPTWGNLEQIFLERDPRDANDGVDNDGDGLIDECQVVWVDDAGLGSERRTVLCRGVAEWLEGETPGNGLDDNGNGMEDETGFAISFDGSRMTVRMTLERMDPYGTLIDHTFERTIVLRNTGL